MANVITMDSFGANLPENWERIAEDLNRIIDRMGIADDHDAVNQLWDDYMSDYDGKWYAILRDSDDDDWGTGTYWLKEAERIARMWREDPEYNAPDPYIAVIVDGVCEAELRDF